MKKSILLVLGFVVVFGAAVSISSCGSSSGAGTGTLTITGKLK
jgi:predicted small secreted protein